MKVELIKGKYVLAVSGGVDSMVLLNMLSKVPGVELVVTHFNHGIRPDSGEDERFVRQTAEKMGLKFVTARGRLGAGASEATARQARYRFLNEVAKKQHAAAVITAHHQDDLIETAIINLLRGTGRRGLAAMMINSRIVRPLLSRSKQDILTYAKLHGIKWRDDPTNDNENYLRNYIRRQLLPSMNAEQRRSILRHINKLVELENSLTPKIATLSQNISRDGIIDRQSFINLPIELGDELLLHWLRQLPVTQPQKKTIQRLNIALRAAKNNTSHPVGSGVNLIIRQNSARFSYSL